MNRSFGMLLREYRNRSVDPTTGRSLSQERLGVLIGETLGTSYSAQAVSDWERDRSQIHKDHRLVLKTLIQVLHTCGGLASPEDAERLLAAGNYRGLTHAELESIFLRAETDPPRSTRAEWIERLLDNHPQETTRPYILVMKAISIILCWLAAWLAISPTLNFSNTDQTMLLREVIILALTGLIVPIVLAWVVSLTPNCTCALPTGFLNYLGGILGFSLGLVNILTLAILSYNLYLYPWPSAVILIISLWPIGLSLVSAELIKTHLQHATGEILFRDIRFRWAIPSLPLLISLGLYHFHHLLSARLLGSFLLVTLSLGLGLLLWSQTREIS